MRIALGLAIAVTLCLGHPQAQSSAASKGPWFGLTLPGGTRAPAVLVGARPPRPVTLPPGEPPAPEFAGAGLHEDVQTIMWLASWPTS